MQFSIASAASNRMQKKVLIEHIKKHVEIDISSEDEISSFFDPKSYSKKDFLLSEGKTSRFEYFIVSGCVRIFVTDKTGVEHNLSFNSENWWAGDLRSFVRSEPATYSIQAIEETSVLQIKRNSWLTMLNEFSAMEKYSRLMFQNAVIAQQTRIVQSISYNAEERYLDFVKSYPNLTQRVSQKHIASYLGITPEFLSMLRRKLTKS